MNNFASKIILSKVSSDLKLLSCHKSTMFSLSVDDIVFILNWDNEVILSDLILSYMCHYNRYLELFPKWFYTITSSKHTINTISLLFLLFWQNEQSKSLLTPICIQATLVAKLLCTSLIWKHFSLISRIICIFLKLVLQLIC